MLRYAVVASSSQSLRRSSKICSSLLWRQLPSSSPANLLCWNSSVPSAQPQQHNDDDDDWRDDHNNNRSTTNDDKQAMDDFFRRRRPPPVVASSLAERRRNRLENNNNGDATSAVATDNSNASSTQQSARQSWRFLGRDPRRGAPQEQQQPSPTSNKSAWRRDAAANKTTTSADEEGPLFRPSFLAHKNAELLEEKKKPAAPYEDMKDVSQLRAAFERSKFNQNNNKPTWRLEQQKSSPRQRNNNNYENRALEERNTNWKSNWRNQQPRGNYNNRRTSQQNQFPARIMMNNNNDDSFMSTRKSFQEQQRHAKETGETTTERRVIELPTHDMSVLDLSTLFRVKKHQLMKIMKSLGVHAQDKHEMVDPDTMELLALELGLEVTRSNRRRMHAENNQLQRRVGEEDSAAYESFPQRPPVVCLMGHVDHGKTTLMDALRARSQSASSSSTNNKKKKKKGSKSIVDETQKVAGTEAGGITQVISAFQVALENQDSAVTFLDTPGHAAFRSMRQSGSNAADVIVLVVAADDGVSPQTVEILDFYKSIVKESGGISLVVAMTKIDKPGVNVDEARARIENQLYEHGIATEGFGSGETEFGAPAQLIPVSGITGEGVDDLIEGLALQSEIMDLRADTTARAEGIVMDARMEKGLGVVVDCVVRWGSMERGDIIVSGTNSGKIKTLKDVNGAIIKQGMPSQPVRIIGFKTLPKAGDPVICVASEEVADKLIERREAALAHETTESRPDNTEDAELHITGNETKRSDMLQNLRDRYGMDDDEGEGGETKQIRIPVIIKADADGTLAAVRESMLNIGAESKLDIVIDPVSTGIGPVSANDVQVASESGAAIFLFNVKQKDQAALALADTNDVTICSHNVIYSLLDKAKEIFAERLPLSRVEHVHGKAVVQAVFDINNKRNAERIAGLRVLDGSLFKSTTKNSEGSLLQCHYRVIRKGKRISPEGKTLKASSLRRVKEDVEDVRRGDECGLGLVDFADFEEGDTIECYSIENKRVFV